VPVVFYPAGAVPAPGERKSRHFHLCPSAATGRLECLGGTLDVLLGAFADELRAEGAFVSVEAAPSGDINPGAQFWIVTSARLRA
jgi:hypothetical protein